MVADALKRDREKANAELWAKLRAVLVRTFLFGAAVYVSGHLLAAHLLGRF